MRQTPWNTPRNVWSESNSPFTLGLIVAAAAIFLLDFLRLPLAHWLTFTGPFDLIQPWRLFTYSIVSTDIIGLLFFGLMLWGVGGSLERSWGTPFYALFWGAMSAITALAMSLGGVLLKAPIPVGYWLPLSALVFAWCVLNQNEEIRLYGVIPVLGKWLAVGEVLIIFFVHARIHPLLGVFALSGCGAAFLWMQSRAWGGVNLYSTLPTWRWGSAPQKPKLKLVPAKPKDDRFSLRDLNPFEWFARARRKKQFEKLMRDD